MSLSVPSVLSNDEEFVVVAAAGQGGVGVFAGEGVVREYEAAVDGRALGLGPWALGLVDSGRVTVDEAARLGVGERNDERLTVAGGEDHLVPAPVDPFDDGARPVQETELIVVT